MPNLLGSSARSSQKSLMLPVVAALLLSSTPVSAQVLCRCALRSLEALVCETQLTARVRVLWGLSLRSGDRLYVARVLDVFRGDAEREILIQAPASCGLALQPFTTYVVSVNRADNGVYSTFACSSFAKPWREITDDEVRVLKEPACAPSCADVTCAPGERCVLEPVWCIRAPCPQRPTCVPAAAGLDEVCYRFSESDASLAVDRDCAAELKCVSTSELAGFNALRVCKPLDYCVNEASAAIDCADLPHQAVLGNWSCSEHVCTWRAGAPNP